MDEQTENQLLHKGWMAITNREYRLADSLISDVLRKNPTHPRGNLYLGLLAWELNKNKHALRHLSIAVEQQPEKLNFQLALIQILLDLVDISSLNSLSDLLRNSKGLITRPSYRTLQDNKKIIEQKLTDQNFVPIRKTLHTKIAKLRTADTLNIATEKDIVRLFHNKKYHEVIDIVEASAPIESHRLKALALMQTSQNEEAISYLKKLIQTYPTDVDLLNMLGETLRKVGQFDVALKVFDRALVIDPKNYEVFSNLALVYHHLGEYEKAIESYNKALKFNENNETIMQNKASTLYIWGYEQEAQDLFEKILLLNPKNTYALHGLGNIFSKRGEFERSIDAHQAALDLMPNYAEACTSLLRIYVQLFNDWKTRNVKGITRLVENKNMEQNLKFNIILAIQSYVERHYEQCAYFIKTYEKFKTSMFAYLPQADQKFCEAYSVYLTNLMDCEIVPYEYRDAKIYHIGESHCLSYAQSCVQLNGVMREITPFIIFGAKAFHFSTPGANQFKKFAENRLNSIPKKSDVFLSFGEIDCRFDEGFLTAAKKLDQSIETLISDTVKGYVDWFALQNVRKNHTLSFFNVPAPIFKNSIEPQVNIRVAETVKKFNAALAKYVAHHNFNLIDVYGFTCSENGFSNEKYHIDGYHLGPHAIEFIEPQLN